jgi:hypothetical protein
MMFDASATFNFKKLKDNLTMAQFLRTLDITTNSKEWYYGTRPIIIVVDEANALKDMANQAVILTHIRI